MKLWLSPYQLKNYLGEIRRGYLVKTQAEDQSPGYSDLFPWPEFGDPDFSEIPFMIQQGKTSPLIQRSLYFSRRDALERTEGVSALKNKTTRNHFIVASSPGAWPEQVEQARSEGFQTVKIKLGRDPQAEIPQLLKLTPLRDNEPWLRLDFNGRGTVEYFREIEGIRSWVQLIEDPFGDQKKWKSFDWPWAYDQPGFPASGVDYFFRVIKPAKQDWREDEKHPLIFTSYLDHPVGMAHAMVEALESGQQIYDYGLMSHRYYEATPFHEYIKTAGPHMTVAGDFGIGFDDLFDEQEWVEL